MAKDNISYEVENDKEFRAKLKWAAEQVGNLRTPLKLISGDFYKSEQAIFNLKGRGQYPDLSKKPFRAFWKNVRGFAALYKGGYKEYKKANYGFDYPILKRTGKLMRSVTAPDRKGSINIITRTTLIIGTSVTSKDGYPYPAVHQFGSKNVPMRKFLFIGPEGQVKHVGRTKGRMERWEKILDLYVSKKLRVLGKVS
jgi:phage gpG-like protein